MVNARLPNGFRVNAVIPPIAIDGPTMTIRKFSDRISTLAHLVDLGSIPDWYAHLLGYAVPVSYTHLDVYKRQRQPHLRRGPDRLLP